MLCDVAVSGTPQQAIALSRQTVELDVRARHTLVMSEHYDDDDVCCCYRANHSRKGMVMVHATPSVHPLLVARSGRVCWRIRVALEVFFRRYYTAPTIPVQQYKKKSQKTAVRTCRRAGMITHDNMSMKAQSREQQAVLTADCCCARVTAHGVAP